MNLDEVLLEKNNKEITKVVIKNSFINFGYSDEFQNKYEEICKKITSLTRRIFNLPLDTTEYDYFNINEIVTDKDFTNNFEYEIGDTEEYLKGEITYLKDFGTNTIAIFSTNIFFNPEITDFYYDENYNETYILRFQYNNKEFLKYIKAFYNKIYNIDLSKQPRFKKTMENYTKNNIQFKELENRIISYYYPSWNIKLVVDNTKKSKKKKDNKNTNQK